METTVSDERARFVRDFESGHWSMTELCERYDVSRPTGYKWLARWEEGAGLADLSHAPHRCPHQTSADLEALIVAARRQYGWGAKKLRPVLRKRHPGRPWPARSTFNEILDRHALNLWWMQLSIVHQRILPASPQENGTHERMHRDLKRETIRPAASSLRAQQRRFDAFRVRYNDERPHEGIGDRTPSSLWTPSVRPYPEHITPPVYPARLEVRRVSSAGTFRLHGQQPFLSEVLRGEDIGLEEVGDGIWNIVYYTTLLEKIDERSLLITGAK